METFCDSFILCDISSIVLMLLDTTCFAILGTTNKIYFHQPLVLECCLMLRFVDTITNHDLHWDYNIHPKTREVWPNPLQSPQ